jgi:hypothetical protein
VRNGIDYREVQRPVRLLDRVAEHAGRPHAEVVGFRVELVAEVDKTGWGVALIGAVAQVMI